MTIMNKKLFYWIFNTTEYNDLNSKHLINNDIIIIIIEYKLYTSYHDHYTKFYISRFYNNWNDGRECYNMLCTYLHKLIKHFTLSQVKKRYKRYIFLFNKCYLYFFVLPTCTLYIPTLNQHICTLLMSSPHFEPLCVPGIVLILLLENQHSDTTVG